MTARYSTQMDKLHNQVPKTLPLNAEFGGHVHIQIADIPLAAQASGDTIEVALLPKGARVLNWQLLTDTSLGSATVALGTAASAAKYKAAAVFTTTDTISSGMLAAAGLAVLTAEETVLLTIAAAALPASGNLRVAMFYSLDS